MRSAAGTAAPAPRAHTQEDYEEFAAHARLMTSIHAQDRRPGPLTTSGGNVPTVSSGAGAKGAGSTEAGKPAAALVDSGSSPNLKRAKPDQVAGGGAGAGVAAKAPAASKVKKSLKRL